MNKIIKSLAVIGAVAAIAVGATSSFFSDTEESKNNTFTAGTIDIELDDKDEPFVNCEAITDLAICKATPRCAWQISNENPPVERGRCVQTTEGVVGTWTTPENWDPGDLWNEWISIHNNGSKNITQILMRASKVDDTDDGANPESEPHDANGTGGGDLMSDDIYLWGAEEFIWPSKQYEENKQAVEVFNGLLQRLGLGNNDLTEDEVRQILAAMDQIGVKLEYRSLTKNFIHVFDTDGDGKAQLDEFDDKNSTGAANCQKDILVDEILEPSQVKILVMHWKFSEDAGNNLQGDKVVADFSFDAVQEGAPEGEVVCGRVLPTLTPVLTIPPNQ